MNPTELTEFEAFVASRWTGLVRAAISMGLDSEAAQDHAQTVLIKCYTSWSRVQRSMNIDSYVYRMLLNTFHDSRRRLWRKEVLAPIFESEMPSKDSIEDGVVGDMGLNDILAWLPVETRKVIVLRVLIGLSEAQTAETLGVPVGTVKSRQSRGIAKLATHPKLVSYIRAEE